MRDLVRRLIIKTFYWAFSITYRHGTYGDRCAICGWFIDAGEVHWHHGGIKDLNGKQYYTCYQCYDWFNNRRDKRELVIKNGSIIYKDSL